jgi:hypothetical protein
MPLVAQLIPLESLQRVCNVSISSVGVIEYCIIFADENSELKILWKLGQAFGYC